MNYQKYIDKLRNEKSISDLQEYLNGTKKFNHRTVSKKQQEELMTKIIPEMIAQMRKDNEEEAKSWYNAPVFRLAYQYCISNRQPITDIFHVASSIVERVNKDNEKVAIRQRFIEYCNRTKDEELL